ncbi:MAG: diguanylate cyclase [Nitrospina sp.]|nr:MAG: diguanylate cyclase [Nitrospina sp.]
METLRDSVIQCINVNSKGDTKFLHELDHIAQRVGDSVYSILLNVLTQLDFNDREAKNLWLEILDHRQRMVVTMNRPVNLATAVCDYMVEIKKSMHSPKVVEMKIFEEASQASQSDFLTGLYNRAYFDKAFNIEIARAQRMKKDCSLVFFDLDDFKKVNDSFGHPAGDLVLKSVAELIFREKRLTDIAVRYGGEEIVLLLPDTSKASAMNLATRIRKKVERSQLVHQGRLIKQTMSGGVASFPLDTDVPEELIECADRALYRAKHKGKNKICLFSSDMRKSIRMDFDEPVEVRQLGVKVLSPPNLAQSKDLSLSGILFECVTLLEVGTPIQIQIPLASKENPLIVLGRVTRVAPKGPSYEVGVSFLDMVHRERKEISSYFSHLLKSQSLLN